MSAIKPRTARVVIYQGDDLAALTALDARVEAAEGAAKKAEKGSGTRLMHEAEPVAEARAALEAIQSERDAFAAAAEDRAVVVVLNAQPRKTWRRLMAEHPARDRDEHPEDYPIGPCNIETLPDELLPLSIDREQSTIEGDLVEFLESLNDHDYYDSLFWTAWTLNRGSASADPTLRLGSAPSQTSAAISS